MYSIRWLLHQGGNFTTELFTNLLKLYFFCNTSYFLLSFDGSCYLSIFSLSLTIFSLSFPIFRYPSLSFHYLSLSFAVPHYLFTIFPYLLLSLTIFSLSLEIVKCGFWRKLPLLPLLWHANAIDENYQFPYLLFH